MSAHQAEAVAALTRECPEAAQWTAHDYASLGRPGIDAPAWNGGGGCVLIAEREGGLAGFAAVRIVADELEVLNLGVAPAQRRMNVGSALIGAAFAAAQRAGAGAAFCEVRESNHAAQKFYARHGFALAARRARYYTGPVEDALVLSKKLG